MHQHPVVASIMNLLSPALVLAGITQIVPPIASIIGVIWYCIMIYESATVQRFIAKRKGRHAAGNG